LKAADFGASLILVVIGCAIITDPTLLVADKSTGDLDRASARGDLGFNHLNLELGKPLSWSLTISAPATRRTRSCI
jgi:predicted ABC-type transport system involved in lysophospholipase L1 biosynthesis ATPase subunit